MEPNNKGLLPFLKKCLLARWPAIVLAITLALGCYLLLPLPQPIRAGLSIFILAGILWLTEAISLTFTALLIPILAALLHVMPVKQAFSNFANPIIFLFLGGFALAAALSRHGIDRAVGQAVLRVGGSHPVRGVYLLFAATGFLSMWISNTATTAMMLPVALGIAGRFHDPHNRNAMFILLGTAYSASICGIATLVGSPPNAIAASHQSMGFDDWLKFGLPVALLLMPLMIGILRLLLKPDFQLRESDPPASAERESGVSHHNPQRTITLIIFIAVVACWILSKPVSSILGIGKDFDAWVAVAGIVALGITGSIQWRDVEEKANWGILLLFGGGITLSAVLDTTGTSAFIAEHLKNLLQQAPTLIAILVITTFVVFLTELVSNTASAALLIPLFVPVSAYFGVPPKAIAVLVAISASCAFMLPVATPPNAIVFGSGLVPQSTMMRCGFVLNLACIVVITGLIYFSVI